MDKKKRGPYKTKLKAAPTVGQRSLLDHFKPSKSDGAQPSPEFTGSSVVLTDATHNGQVESPGLAARPIAQNASTLRSHHEAVNHDDEEIIEMDRPRNVAPVLPYSHGQSRDAPIVIDSSPVKDKSAIAPSKTNFTPSKRLPKKNALEETPFPDCFSQHARGNQTRFTAPPLQLGRRPQRNFATTENNHDVSLSSLRLVDGCATSTNVTSSAESPLHNKTDGCIPPDHIQEHPAISRTAGSATNRSGSVSSLWTDRWHPTRAEQVLGNHHLALYLRDWINALAIKLEVVADPAVEGKKTTAKGRKRPRVLRAVDKKARKKQKTDDWIVESDGEEEEEAFQDVDDDAEFVGSHELNSPESNPLPVQNFDSLLTNTIVISGPVGVGKTAAVYACAEELDFEIFEVYPGVGKRSGTNINSLIGEVGSSHLVGKAHAKDPVAPQPSSKGLTNFFANNRAHAQHTTVSSPIISKSEQAPDLGFLKSSISLGNGNARKHNSVRQSMILLEEVDIIFKDDVNFWPMFTKFIAECKRPVILTCNDVSLIPLQDLPVQKVLEFKPCPPPVAVSYLQSICLAEGKRLSREKAASVYAMTHSVGLIDIPSMPTHPFTDPLPLPDLRRSINYLQFLTCADCPLESVSDKASTTLPAFASLADYAEVVSFLDSDVIQSPLSAEDKLALSSWDKTDDDEIGHTILYHTTGNRPTPGAVGFRCADEEIYTSAIGISARLLGTNADTFTAFTPHALFEDRVSFQYKVLRAIGRSLSISGCLLPSPAVFLDYLPWIRAMVTSDDEQEVQGGNVKSRNGRMTRATSQRKIPAYDRWIDITSEERTLLNQTSIGYAPNSKAETCT